MPQTSADQAPGEDGGLRRRLAVAWSLRPRLRLPGWIVRLRAVLVDSVARLHAILVDTATWHRVSRQALTATRAVILVAIVSLVLAAGAFAASTFYGQYGAPRMQESQIAWMARAATYDRAGCRRRGDRSARCREGRRHGDQRRRGALQRTGHAGIRAGSQIHHPGARLRHHPGQLQSGESTGGRHLFRRRLPWQRELAVRYADLHRSVHS